MRIVNGLLLLLFLAACQPATEEWPQELDDKKRVLKAKRNELAELTKEVEKLQAEISQLEPNLATQGKLVTVSPIARKNFEHYVEIQGIVSSGRTVNVTSEVPGRIKNLTVDEGDRVRQGQLIAEVDLAQITKQIEEVEISLNLANTVFERQNRLWEQNIGSEIQYLEAENNKKRLEKNLDALQVQMEKGQIYSPISGVVDRKILGTGELASPGSPILQLLDVNDLRVEADVPETYLREVQLGETVRVRYPALDMEQNARVSLIGSKIKNANRTFKVEAKVKNLNGLLKPNLLAIMYIRDFAVEDAIVVQQELVQQEVSGKDYVLIKAEENGKFIARKVYVTTGKSYNNQVQILEGLEEGAEIIIEGARGLAAGQPIRIQEAKTEARNG